MIRNRVVGCLGVVLCCALGPTPAAAAQDPLAGDWRGSAWFQGARLEFGVHFQREGTRLHATFTSLDLMLLEQPLVDVNNTGRDVRFTTPDDHPLRFRGTVTGDSLRGTASAPAVPGVYRPGATPALVTFVLGRTRAAAALPYRMREVTIAAGAVRLAGTLLVPPPHGGTSGGIVLLTGSTADLRADARFYADHFARAGLCVLIFDKRGSGQSTGDLASASFDDLAADASAAVEALRRQPEVDSVRVGIWGISQGAFIAPLVAARVPSLAFIVAVSAPGLPIGECAAFQDSARLSDLGFDAADIQRVTTLDRRLLEWLRTGRDRDEMSARLAEAASTPWRRASSVPARLPTGAALEGWYWRGRTLDPYPRWLKVQVPVLAVYGAADELIPARHSARLVEHALDKAKNRDVTVRVFPAANHILRTLPLVAGGRWDWPRVAPGYLELVTSWVLEHVDPRPPKLHHR